MVRNNNNKNNNNTTGSTSAFPTSRAAAAKSTSSSTKQQQHQQQPSPEAASPTSSVSSPPTTTTTTVTWSHPEHVALASASPSTPHFPCHDPSAIVVAKLAVPPYYQPDVTGRLLEANYTLLPLPDGEEETDHHRLSQRMKQIAFGKNTPGYQVYDAAVPRHKRQFGNPNHPVTPRLNFRCPKRSWDNLVGQWRRALHLWDEQPAPSDMTVPGLPTLDQMGLEPVAFGPPKTTTTTTTT
eukprot:PhM_4_TR15678/c0_g1_i1/m.57878/K18710/SLBP; histone RNA hairpin-binding protein